VSLLASYVKNPEERRKVGVVFGIAALLVLAGFVYVPAVLIHTVPLHCGNIRARTSMWLPSRESGSFLPFPFPRFSGW
jgi:hypothetical protein